MLHQTGIKNVELKKKNSYWTVHLSERTQRSLGADNYLPVASSSSKHLMEGKLPVQVLLDDIQPLWISRLSLQFLQRGEMKNAKMSESQI